MGVGSGGKEDFSGLRRVERIERMGYGFAEGGRWIENDYRGEKADLIVCVEV